jgi:hypothetical protein
MFVLLKLLSVIKMYKTTYYITFFAFLISFSISSCTKQSEKRNNKNPFEKEIDFQVFENPTNEFRSFPFYSINDSLDEIEIKNQIADFKQAGFGGFYLHSRLGLITEFLSDDWWKIMGASVDAANEVGIQAMFYDEDKWPSGYAGGIMPKMSEGYRAKCLVRLDKNTTLPPGSELIKTDNAYNYILYTAQFGYDIFNGTCYVDLFNPEMVRKFIEVSYLPYVGKYKSKIKDYTFAIFSDEPHVHARYFDKNTAHKGVLSYSPWLEKKFEELYGYPLRDKLDMLFEEKDNWREVRMQYYRAKALQFEESYTKQISAFARENGFDFTGHYLGEDVLEKVRDRIGNSMLHYRNMQQPGMDHLGLTLENGILTAKSLSSVANQYGIRKRLSELFGISGQNMNFEDRKWIAGWHSILGINHFCPHLTLYSMKGARKRDYPPTFSYQQPYWDYNKTIEDYLGRISYATMVGEYVPQILVVNPLESEYIKGKNDGEFTSGINKVLDFLQANHYDYDIGDEQILADTAMVHDNELIIGAMSYKHIVLPDMISIRQSTIDLISELNKNGGLIFSIGRFPKFIDGIENEAQLSELKKLLIMASDEDFGKIVLEKVTPNVIISGKEIGGIWSQTRITEDGKLVQLYNSSHTKPVQFEVKADFKHGNVILWDPSLVRCFKLEPSKNGFYQIEIEASSNVWITSGELSKNAVAESDYSLPAKTVEIISLDKKWLGKKSNPNAITLDFAAYSIDNGKTFSKTEPVIGIFSRLSDNNYYGDLTLQFNVDILEVPAQCRLVLEQPEMFNSIKINGGDFQYKPEGFYVDHTFKTDDITANLKKGENTISISLNFEPTDAANENPHKRYGTEIESIYLIGDFAVLGKSSNTTETQKNKTGNFPIRPIHQFSSFTIGAEKEMFEGNLTLEGYPFYAGSFKLKQSFSLKSIDPAKKYFIELPNCESIATSIKMNGQVVDTLFWSPFKTEITKFLKEGDNEVEITLVNSLRNLLGPHHHKGGEIEKVGPNSFTGVGGFPDGRGEANWYDLRKENKPTAIWTDTYSNIPFGFIEPVRITLN